MHMTHNRLTKETIQRCRQTRNTLCAIVTISLFIYLLNAFFVESHKINRKNGYIPFGMVGEKAIRTKNKTVIQ